MKAESLYHLLMLRLKELPQGALPAGFAAALRNGLKVADERNVLIVTWPWAGKTHELRLPGDRFEFHVRGDVPTRAPAQGGRDRNWSAATKLIGEIAETSGMPFADPGAARALAPVPELAVPPSSSWAARLAPAIIPLLGGLILPLVPGLEALAAALASVLLILFAERIGEVVSALRIGTLDRIVIAAGTLGAAHVGSTALGVAGLAAAALLAAAEEERGTAKAPERWAVVGALAASPALAYGKAALAVPVIMALLLAAMSIVMSYRMSRWSVAAFVAGAVPFAVFALAFGTGWRDASSTLALWLLPLAVVLLLGWTMLGRQHLLTPWIAVAAWSGALLFAAPFMKGLAGMAALAGLFLVGAVRFALLLASTARPRVVSGADAGPGPRAEAVP